MSPPRYTATSLAKITPSVRYFKVFVVTMDCEASRTSVGCENHAGDKCGMGKPWSGISCSSQAGGTAGAKEGEVWPCFGTSAETLSPSSILPGQFLEKRFFSSTWCFWRLISKLRGNSHVGRRPPEDGAARSADAQAGRGHCQHK